MAETSAMTIAVNIFASPREAFAAIREKPRFWLPLLLILLGVCVTTYLYMSGVDVAWFYEQQMLIANPNATDAQIEQTVNAVSNMPQPVLATLGAASGMLVIAIIFLLYALYLKIVSVVLKDGILFKHWFGLACWAALPSLLSYIATTVNLVTSDVTLMPQTDVNPLSFVNLFGLESAGTGMIDRVAMNMDVTSIWTVALLILGYNAWTRKGIALSTFIAIAPYLLIIGVAIAA